MEFVQLHKHVETFKNTYPELTFAYCALFGSQNYELSTTTSDVDSKTIVIPTCKEAVFSSCVVSHELDVENEHTLVQDVRKYFNSLYKSNINFLETLFTDFYVVNDKFNKYIMSLREHADFVANRDMKALCTVTFGMINSKYKKVVGKTEDTEDLFEQYSYNPKELSALVRLNYFLHDVVEKGFRDSLVPELEDRKYLLKLKYEPISMDAAMHLRELMYFDAKDFVDNFEFTENLNSSIEVKNYLDNLAFDMICANN